MISNAILAGSRATKSNVLVTLPPLILSQHIQERREFGSCTQRAFRSGGGNHHSETRWTAMVVPKFDVNFDLAKIEMRGIRFAFKQAVTSDQAYFIKV